ncbi:MAG: ABC transporter ATP-binding protein [Dehalococcoidia bacterium]|nr:ABC transporter ATP-binding protein [Dehalococcoidia bacterium]
MGNGSAIATETALETRLVSKRFGNRLVLRDVSVSIRKGELAVLFGPNGAGKTTLLRILATIMNPTSGNVLVTGMNIKEDAEDARRKIGVVSHQTFLYNDLTIRENLEFYARMFDVPHRRERIGEVVEMVGMTPRLNDRIGTLSRGMQQRVAIARAILHKPEILLLDEPETGLDLKIISVLWKTLLGEGGEKRTVVFTTHDLERGIELGDRFLVLSRGAIIYDSSKEQMDVTHLRETYDRCSGVSV